VSERFFVLEEVDKKLIGDRYHDIAADDSDHQNRLGAPGVYGSGST